jgi:hypothetical protein
MLRLSRLIIAFLRTLTCGIGHAAEQRLAPSRLLVRTFFLGRSFAASALR